MLEAATSTDWAEKTRALAPLVREHRDAGGGSAMGTRRRSCSRYWTSQASSVSQSRAAVSTMA